MKFSSFLFSAPSGSPIMNYVYVALRAIMASFWIVNDIPRWVALAAGQPASNGLVRTLFGTSFAIPLTYLFTLFETLSAIALLLGFMTRLAAVWQVVEFVINGTIGVLTGNIGLFHDYANFAGGLVLLVNGSPWLSVDGLLAKRMKK